MLNQLARFMKGWARIKSALNNAWANKHCCSLTPTHILYANRALFKAKKAKKQWGSPPPPPKG